MKRAFVITPETFISQAEQEEFEREAEAMNARMDKELIEELEQDMREILAALEPNIEDKIH